MLAYLPYTGVESLPDWSLAEQRVLLGRLDGFSLAYQLDDGGEWREAWRSPEPRPWPVSVFRSPPPGVHGL
jgi:hypothetical protein